MNYMMNYGYDHGIFPENTEFQIPNDTIHINGYIDLATFCDNASIDFEVLKKLNPQITKKILPDQTRDFVLKVPSVQFTYLMSNRASIMDSCTKRYLPSGVMVARADSTKTDSLAGNGSFPYVLASNVQNVSDDENYDEDGEEDVVQRSRTKRVSYTVRRGDNVAGIARKYGVSVASVRKWNHIRRNNIRRRAAPGDL